LGVPGEVAGLWTAYERYGSRRVPWRRLIEPSIELATGGHALSATVAEVLMMTNITDDAITRNYHHPITHRPKRPTDIIRLPQFAQTLQRLADAKNAVRRRVCTELFFGKGEKECDLHNCHSVHTPPADEFYSGALAGDIAKELAAGGAYVDADDMRAYRVRVHDTHALWAHISTEHTVCTPPAPSGAPLVVALLKTMNGRCARNVVFIYRISELHLSPQTTRSPAAYTSFLHKFIEFCKYTYAQRQQMGDPNYVTGMENVSTSPVAPK
jgi:gamma-glutamyltranspeptidase